MTTTRATNKEDERPVEFRVSCTLGNRYRTEDLILTLRSSGRPFLTSSYSSDQHELTVRAIDALVHALRALRPHAVEHELRLARAEALHTQRLAEEALLLAKSAAEVVTRMEAETTQTGESTSWPQ